MARGGRRFGGSSLVSGANRRRTGWEEGPGVNAQVQFTASSSAILGAGQEALEDGLTIVRIRGSIELLLAAATAVGDGFLGAIGIGIVSTPAFAVGITAVPTPITEIEWEGWLYHRFIQHRSSVATAGFVGANIQRIEIDTKAMRKISTQEVVFMAAEFTEGGTADMRVAAGTRMLVKLP